MGILTSVITLPHAAPVAVSARAGTAREAELARPVERVEGVTPPRDEPRARRFRDEARDSQRSDEHARANSTAASGAAGGFTGRRPAGAQGPATPPVLVQLLEQNNSPDTGPLSQHRDAQALGSEAYRRAGAEPTIYPEQPTVFSVSI